MQGSCYLKNRPVITATAAAVVNNNNHNKNERLDKYFDQARNLKVYHGPIWICEMDI